MKRLALWLPILLVSLLAAAAVQAQSVTKTTFNTLNRVQELMDAEQYAEAQVELEVLVESRRDIPYDFAIANQYLAHVKVMQGDTEGAIIALRSALASEDLPQQVKSDMNLFYGTVLLGEGEYEEARIVLERWYEGALIPNPRQIFSTAYANYMSGQVERAEFLVEEALSQAKEPQESWNQLYYQILFDLKKFEQSEEVLMGMIARNPENAPYWRILVSHHMQLEDSGEALAAFMTAYNGDLIDEKADLEQIFNLYAYIDVPEKGARLLEAWIEEGRLEGNAETLKRLGELWLIAREREQAMPVLERAAELSPDGRTFELLGGIFFEDEEWELAYDAYRKAIRAGGLEEPLRISLLAGISAFRAGNMEDARSALQDAAESEEYREQAERLLKQIDRG